jgi:riboflavin biosynthesis pyrimidine reductase
VRQIFPRGSGTAYRGSDGGAGRTGRVDLAAVYAYPPGSAATRAGKPAAWVRANMVMSADGAASSKGRSGAISGKWDREIFLTLRGLADVIVVGAQTVRAERYGPARARPGWAPLRAGRPPVPPIAIVTGSLDLDLSSPLFTAAPADARTIVLTTEAAPPKQLELARECADVIVAGSRRVDLRAAIIALARRGLHRVLTEGGPLLLGQFVAADLLDELCLTVSPLLAGGEDMRVVAGALLQEPRRLRLGHVLEAEGSLFCRYEAAAITGGAGQGASGGTIGEDAGR